jgi:cytochrome c biogenesis protein CcmG/thiol:disulfide interchange protein DsbE
VTRWIAVAVVVALVAVSVVLATRPSVQATQADSPLLGNAAPAFSATSFEGGHVSLSQFRGRYVFLNFFASWCAPCQQEAPNLEQFAFAQSRSKGGAALVSIDFSDTNAGARRFLATYGPTWPSLEDPGGTIAYDYGVESPPTTFLVSPAGKVVGDLIGPVSVANLDNLLGQARAAARSSRAR